MTDTVAPAAPFALPGLNPCATHIRAEVVEQVRLAQDTFRVRIECPEIAARVVPGQFFMIREPGRRNRSWGAPSPSTTRGWGRTALRAESMSCSSSWGG